MGLLNSEEQRRGNTVEATDARKDLQKETEVIEQLKTAFSAKILESQVGRKNRPRVVISPEDALPILRYAKDTQGFEHLSAVIGIDMIDYFAVAYMLGSWSNGLMLEVLVRINDLENPTLPSVTSLWETANWHEREVFDLRTPISFIPFVNPINNQKTLFV
jgi:NADH-quinone oxidoreductase subunit C